MGIKNLVFYRGDRHKSKFSWRIIQAEQD